MQVEELKRRYREGTVGDVEVKEKLTAAINEFLEPIRRRKEEIEADSGYVEQVIYEGSLRTNKIAEETSMMMKKYPERQNLLYALRSKRRRKGMKRGLLLVDIQKDYFPGGRVELPVLRCGRFHSRGPPPLTRALVEHM